MPNSWGYLIEPDVYIYIYICTRCETDIRFFLNQPESDFIYHFPINLEPEMVI